MAPRRPRHWFALREFLKNGTIERLSNVLGLSHSATVRLVDRLVDYGYVVRHRGRADGGEVAVQLTDRGRAIAGKVRVARRQTTANGLRSMNERQLRSLLEAIDGMLVKLTRERLESRSRAQAPLNGWLCRLCDFKACGRALGQCPVATAAAQTPYQGAP